MNLEAIGVGLSAATLIVIAATAVAAIIQLRHLRASNQLSALLEILDQWNKPHLQTAYSRFLRDLPTKLADDDYRKQIESPRSQDRESHPEFLIFDLWEQVGTYAKYGLVDERILLDIVSAQVTNAWRLGWPVIEILRKRSGPATFENFEYLAVRATFFHKQFADGAYPKGMPRMDDLQRSDPTTSPPA